MNIRIFFVVLAVIFCMGSCNTSFYDEKEMLSHLGKDSSISLICDNIWITQLERIKNQPPNLLNKSGISLVNYELLDLLDSETKIMNYKNEIKQNENMIPCYISIDEIKAITKEEARCSNSSNQLYTFSKLENYVDSVVKLNTKIVRLEWNNNGDIENTLCVVSDKDGILYDNFITNTIVINAPEISESEILNSNLGTNIIRLKTNSESGVVNKYYEWTLKGTASWLWGTERGSAEIVHIGYYDAQERFIYHDFNASHYFILGNSDAEVSEVDLNTIAYGYGFSTPGITISLTFTGQIYTLSFSSTLGSTAGDTGWHTHPTQR